MTSEPDEVVVQFPARPEFLRLARLAAADAGSRAGLDYEEIEDLRLAVSELCAMISADDGSPISLVFLLRQDAVQVDGVVSASNDARLAGDQDLARELVGAAVDEHTLTTDGLEARFHLVKRRRHQ